MLSHEIINDEYFFITRYGDKIFYRDEELIIDIEENDVESNKVGLVFYDTELRTIINNINKILGLPTFNLITVVNNTKYRPDRIVNVSGKISLKYEYNHIHCYFDGYIL